MEERMYDYYSERTASSKIPHYASRGPGFVLGLIAIPVMKGALWCGRQLRQLAKDHPKYGLALRVADFVCKAIGFAAYSWSLLAITFSLGRLGEELFGRVSLHFMGGFGFLAISKIGIIVGMLPGLFLAYKNFEDYIDYVVD